MGRNHGSNTVLHSWIALCVGSAVHPEGAMRPATAGKLFDRWLATGREVAVVGLGKSGVSATLLLRELGLPIYASDSGDGPVFAAWARTLREAGAEVELGGHDLERVSRSAAVVVAPGVPPEVPPLQAARRAGLDIHAEVDVGFV